MFISVVTFNFGSFFVIVVSKKKIQIRALNFGSPPNGVNSIENLHRDE